jgi:hypothetical protein
VGYVDREGRAVGVVADGFFLAKTIEVDYTGNKDARGDQCVEHRACSTIELYVR